MPRSHDPRTTDTWSSPLFSEVLERRLSRREALKAGVVLAAGVAASPLLGPHRAGGAISETAPSAVPGLGFTAVEPKDVDEVAVPQGYDAKWLIRWGDPLRPGLGPFDVNAQSARSQEQRFGFSNDFAAFFPLPRRSRSSSHGLLWVNHEFSLERLMFPDWDPADPTQDQVDVAQAAVGGTVVEVARDHKGVWTYDAASPYNRRVTATTPMRLTGPAAGSPWLQTGADPTGRWVLGTFANCAGGVTPWGTVLSAEENFDWYFNFGTYLASAPDGPIKCAHQAYYKKESDGQDRGWHRYYDRFDLFKEPHEPFRFGWVVEIDPYDPASIPRKHTALGRLKHEGAVTTLGGDGQAVVYSGEDEEFKFVYKFVSAGRFDPGDHHANRDLLEQGMLHAASFSEDGSGVWLPLVFGTDRLREPDFVSQADVLVRARQAAELAGATRMDRAEGIEVDPLDGRVYVALTKNPKRQTAADRDKPNPRWPNEFGHVIKLTEDGGDAAAISFRWDIFLLCGDPAHLVTDLGAVDWSQPEASKTSYFAGYSDAAHISPIATPDNLVFDMAGNLWIATDGQGDAERFGTRDALHAVPTQGPEKGRVRQFLSAVKGAEVTGPCFTPDNDTLFVSIQHPGKTPTSRLAAPADSPEAPTSHWPDGSPNPPRPSVVVVTKQDGGIIGS